MSSYGLPKFLGSYLPDVDIRIKVPQRQFMLSFEELSKKNAYTEIELDVLGFEQFDVLYLHREDNISHVGLRFALIARPERRNFISIECSAERWHQHPPDREMYIEAIRSMIRPILRRYNQRHGTKYRIRVEKFRAASQLLTKNTRMHLENFTNASNKSALHPLDWNRFYKFTSKCRQYVPENVLTQALIEKGFAVDSAQHIAEIYTHLRAFKSWVGR